MKLYETYFEIEQLWARVEDILNGDVTEGPDGLPVTPEMALDWIEEALSGIEGERDTKALNIACLIKNFRADAAALKEEKLRLAKRQQSCERTVERLTRYLEQFLPGGTKLKDARCVISWRRSEAVDFTGRPDELPEDYQRVKIEANISAIKDALKAGETINGAELIERQNLQVR